MMWYLPIHAIAIDLRVLALSSGTRLSTCIEQGLLFLATPL